MRTRLQVAIFAVDQQGHCTAARGSPVTATPGDEMEGGYTIQVEFEPKCRGRQVARLGRCAAGNATTNALVRRRNSVMPVSGLAW